MARSRRGRGGRGYSYERREEPELHPVRADLHIHTPYSADYQDLDATYLQILQAADARGLGIIALTDHNTAGGIAAMRREIEDLTLLEDLNRLSEEEAQILTEYRRLLGQILVLPGIEFTAAYGFHVLGIFPPDTSVRHLEHLLLTLGLTEAQLDAGSAQVENTADVLTAYEIIDEFGGLVIPAHANIARGVAMQAARYGEQTKIAYTQSPLIAALEVTDLDDSSRRGSAVFFNGTHPDYPRQMHLIQGSDAHRVTRDGARRDTDLGVGDRAMELMLTERSFTALRQLFASDTFTRERPYFPVPERTADPILAAHDIGPTITQAFHEQARSRRSRFRPILKDVVAFANTNGGTIYIGLSPNPNAPVTGVPLVDEATRGLRDAATRSIVPRLDVTVEIENVQGKAIIVVQVPKGPNTPYATEAGQVFVRQDAETVIALRDEIVQLVRESVRDGDASPPAAPGDRHWNTPRPTVDFDEEDAEGDREPTRRALAPSAPPAPPVRATPSATQTLPPVVPVPSAQAAPASAAPLLPPASIAAPVSSPVVGTLETPSNVPAPAPAPVVRIPHTPLAPVASAPLPTPVPETPLSPIDTLVPTVPGVQTPPPTDVAPPDDTARSIEAAASPAPPASSRPPRRRPSRARGAGSDANTPAEPIPPTPSATHAEATRTHAETLPVYSLEPAQEQASPASPVEILSVSDTGIAAEATGEEAEATAGPVPAPATPAPRRRRRTPAKGKETTASADAAPEADSTPATPATPDAGGVTDATDPPTPVPPQGDTTAIEGGTVVSESGPVLPPTTGAEILAIEETPDGRKYTMRDLQSGRISRDVTRKSARGQSRQAILAREDRLPNEEKIIWHGARGYGRTVTRDGAPQYDLALREPDGQVRIFYAVTRDGLDSAWQMAIAEV